MIFTGKFGVYAFAAAILSFSPLAIIIAMLGTLNFIVMKQLMKDEGTSEGPLLYHKTEILCDIIVAVMAIGSDEAQLGTITEWLHYVFRGIIKDKREKKRIVIHANAKKSVNFTDLNCF